MGDLDEQVRRARAAQAAYARARYQYEPPPSFLNITPEKKELGRKIKHIGGAAFLFSLFCFDQLTGANAARANAARARSRNR